MTAAAIRVPGHLAGAKDLSSRVLVHRCSYTTAPYAA